MSKKICLVRCPAPFLLDDHVFPPLGLLAVGTYYQEAGYDVHIHDGTIYTIPMDWPEYGLGPTTPEYPHALDALKYIRKHNPKAMVTIGGPHASALPGDCVEDGFDYVIPGRLRFTGRINYGLVKIRDYKYFIDGQLATTMLTSFGCPFHCAFCSKVARRTIFRPLDVVIDEIEYLQRAFDYNALMIFDDTFILKKVRAETIMWNLHRLGIIFRCFVRGDLIVKHGQRFADSMKFWGCKEVGIGIESGSDEILFKMNKGENVGTIMLAIRMLKQAGIRVKGFFIVGLPGESRRTLEDTEHFLQETQLDDMDFTVFQPMPGSDVWHYPERYDYQWDKEIDFKKTFYKGKPGEYTVNIMTSHLTAKEILEARDYFERTYKPR